MSKKLKKGQREDAQRLLDMLEGRSIAQARKDAEWKKYIPVVILVLIALLLLVAVIFGPTWMKVLVILWVIYRVYTNREKINSWFD